MFVVDTNILLYAANSECAEHDEIRAAVDLWRQGSEAWFITWPIAYEFLRVVTHRAVFKRPLKIADAWKFVDALLDTPGLGVLVETPLHREIVRDLLELHPRISGNLLHDVHTVALMKEHGVSEIRTADTDFHQFKFLRVVNPLGK